MAQCPGCQALLPPRAPSCPECGRDLAAPPAVRRTVNMPAAAAPRLQPGTKVRDPRCDNCKTMSSRGSLVCERCGDALALEAGTVLPSRAESYRLDKHLKSGGFGAVYKATRRSDNRVVAVKEMICPNPAERQTRYEFFLREAEILKNAQAFRVVPQFHEFFEVGTDAYLALEFIQGGDLLRVMERTGNPFPINKVLDWGAQICDVLDWMHTRNPPMIHRDLKPENIMLLDDGSTIKLIDYGTVRAKPTGRSVIVFSEGYSPIEQIGGKAQLRSDIFALAATMFHLLTNQKPVAENTPALTSVNPALPAWLSELLQINLREDPTERYISIMDFKQDLLAQRVTTSVVCGDCQQSNPARTPFCQRCGAPLNHSMVKCPGSNCGQMNVGGSLYCIFCGHRL